MAGEKSRIATRQNVSKRQYNFSSDARIEALKQVKLKKSSESKVNWGVTAYTDWRNNRLLNYQYDYAIFSANLEDLESLEKENLIHFSL